MGTQLPTNYLGAGSVVQVVQTLVTSPYSLGYGSSAYQTLSGFSATITPKSASNKVLAIASVCGEISANAYVVGFAFERNTTFIGVGSGGSQFNASSIFDTYKTQGSLSGTPSSFMVLDSPASASALTYQLRAYCYSGVTLYINRNANGTYWVTSSSVTLMEIAA